MSRPSYYHEMVNACTFPVALSLVEGAVIGTLAMKAFDITKMQYATLIAAPMFANLTSFLWSYLSRNRRKVRMLVALNAGLVLSVGAIGLSPDNASKPWLIIAFMVLARSLQAGIVTVRSVVWRMNYPRHLRAQITGQLVTINAVIMAITPLVASRLLDIDRGWFGWIYVGSVLVAMIGVLSFSRIRLRHEKQLLRYEATPSVAEAHRMQQVDTHGDIEAIDQANLRVTVWSVLRDDRHFRWYLIWQYVGGMANMMGETVIIYIIGKLTIGFEDWEYTVTMLLNSTVPMVTMIVAMHLWARYMDRVHIVQFRSRQSILWVVNQAMNWIGAAMGSLVFLFFQRVGQGFTRGGGTLAWHLGHNDFSSRDAAPVYMGIHVTLTGVRGLSSPFIAMALFEIPGIGYHVFLITTGMAVISLIGYLVLHRQIERTRGDDETLTLN